MCFHRSIITPALTLCVVLGIVVLTIWLAGWLSGGQALLVGGLLLLGNGAVALRHYRHTHSAFSRPNDVSQQELLQAISDAKIGYAVLNSGGEILYASESANRLMGFSADNDIAGKVWYDLDYENSELKAARRETWQEYIADRSPWNGVVRWVNEHGHKCYYDYSICSLSEDRIILVIIDRTDRIQASREIQDRERLHNFVLDNLPLSVTLHDTDRRVIYSNSYLPNRLGIPHHQVTGTLPEQLLSPDTAAALQELYKTVLSTHEPAEGKQISVAAGPMAGTHWLIFMYPVVQKGELEQVLVVALDRTERVRLAREREEFSRKLYETQKIEALNKFAGGLAHELSNLLHPAGVYARALKNDPALRESEKYLSRINDAILKSGEILRRTLSMSRSDSEGPAALDLKEFLRELTGYARDIAPRRLTYGLHLPDQTVIALADPAELQQVLMNLMINAADAQNNTGTITISCGNGGTPSDSLGITARHRGPYAWIDVTDTGKGMDKEVRAKIFEPFFTTKHGDKGTGLGLSVVQGMVTGWGGVVEVSTTLGKGSTFRVWIPAASNVPVASEEPESGKNTGH